MYMDHEKLTGLVGKYRISRTV
jgi:hypothetical protein